MLKEYCDRALYEKKMLYIYSGFSTLFMIMDPIPWEVKAVFHGFGLCNFIFGITLAVYTAEAKDCVSRL